MGSYHSSFGYLNKKDAYGNEIKDKDGNLIKLNSFNDYNFLITSFEPEDGFTDTFLATENISDNYDGTKKFNYGTKYTNSAEIQITMIKSDKSDLSTKEFRDCAKWLTGAKVDSWLDMYVGDPSIETNNVYSFLGKFTNLEHYKLDGRIIGVKATFSSISPWAWSRPIEITMSIDQIMALTNAGENEEEQDGVLFKKGKESDQENGHDLEQENENKDEEKDESQFFGVDENGVLYADGSDEKSYFKVDEDGVIYFDTSISREIDNESDDLYTYIYLDIKYENASSKFVTITNETLNETTRIDNMFTNEVISVSSKQFILSDKEDRKAFGDDFNFVWPRMAPGVNKFIVEGSGSGAMYFTYRYPMKIGDCAMDITVYGGDDDGGCGNIASYDTIKWEDIIGAPTTLSGYGITDAYTKDEVYNKNETYSQDDVYRKDETYSQDDVYNKDETYSKETVYTKDEVYSKEETYHKDNVYTKDNVYSKDETYAKEDLYTKDQVYAKSETYSKEDVYNKDETYPMDNVYTKTEVDTKIQNIEISGGTGTGEGGSVTIDEQALNDMLADILS